MTSPPLNIISTAETLLLYESKLKMDANPEFIEEVKLGLQDAEAGRWVRDEDIEAFTRPTNAPLELPGLMVGPPNLPQPPRIKP